MPAPGVVLTTATAPGPSSLLVAPASTYFAVGITERGPVGTPILIRSVAEYIAKCGNQVAYGALYYDLVNFFAKGGVQAYVSRVVGPAATKGTLTLNDRAGSPLPTLTITAKNEGAWSTQVSVQVINGQVANTFTVIVSFNGIQVRRYANLPNPAAAVVAMAGDPYVTVTQVADVTAAPNNNPAIVGPVALSAGADDRASVNTAVYAAGIAVFTADLGTGVVAVPGQTVDTIGTAIEAHCLTNGRIGYCAAAQGVAISSVIASTSPLVGTAGSEGIGVIYPWVKAPDGFGGVVTVSPEGYVAGCRALAHLTVGPWRAPAGDFAAAPNLLGTDVPLLDADGANLDNNNVSAIRVITGSVELYGYQSLSSDTLNYPLLTDKDFLNYVAWSVKQLLLPYVFETVDGRGQFFAKMTADISGFLEQIKAKGGIFPLLDANGNVLDKGYLVDCGPDVNTDSQLAQNIVQAKVEVRKSPTAKLINVGVIKVALTASL